MIVLSNESWVLRTEIRGVRSPSRKAPDPIRCLSTHCSALSTSVRGLGEGKSKKETQ